MLLELIYNAPSVDTRGWEPPTMALRVVSSIVSSNNHTLNFMGLLKGNPFLTRNGC